MQLVEGKSAARVPLINLFGLVQRAQKKKGSCEAIRECSDINTLLKFKKNKYKTRAKGPAGSSKTRKKAANCDEVFCNSTS